MLKRVQKNVVALTAICVFVLLVIVAQHRDLVSPFVKSRVQLMYKGESRLLHQQRAFWRQFYRDLDDFGPKTFALTHPEGTNLAIGYDPDLARGRPDLLSMTTTQLTALKEGHRWFVDAMNHRKYSLPYSPGTRGIVTTAGGAYLNVALVSIRMLRRTGSVLPVEIFLADWSEFDAEICGHVMPSLGATCVVLEDIFASDESFKAPPIEKYQFKVMAILFSSFEEVLFLDSDCFPIYDPNPLFDQQPFTDTGLVLWPDFWFPSETFLFFEIAEIDNPDIHNKASTEAGEIMYSKRRHEADILLAAYYNYYGPGFYYPLQSQGAPGEGDKETFVWAAVAMNSSYYNVKRAVAAVGYISSTGDWHGSTMVQFDPAQDFAHNTTDTKSVPQPSEAHHSKETYPRPFFLHVNFPKIDPGQIFLPVPHTSFGVYTSVYDAGEPRRIWHSNATAAERFFGFDVERVLWTEVKDIACRYEKKFSAWKKQKGICADATSYLDTVFGEHMDR